MEELRLLHLEAPAPKTGLQCRRSGPGWQNRNEDRNSTLARPSTVRVTWLKRHMVDLAVQGLAHSEHELSQTTSITRSRPNTSTAVRRSEFPYGVVANKKRI